ncbi:hypothetical protein FRACYDRAFT_269250 [Fragilariopsis cylindrus CCMP1102]|uniref:Uncharacterized protein n=1 Tax=Fragilariopsis cylindrus CCMP1102 TaxID=635003 RepID=A0A1E7FAI1_9STRA|nr:hypothetical protein FRACYDRAFT_269250 [Fragilariopsis cylindrus CCMP1102]|eukprot:OEU15171.1 hypothetical protein FRACYDRAFT_269250 [Fragilariopsis cylindrus CCMP1102]
MSLFVSRIAAVRVMTRRVAPVQKRPIVSYLTNYPDKVNEIKKIQCKGGTQQGEANPTWLKQSSDKMVAGFVFAVAAMGLLRLGSGYYKLATGKGKME